MTPPYFGIASTYLAAALHLPLPAAPTHHGLWALVFISTHSLANARGYMQRGRMHEMNALHLWRILGQESYACHLPSSRQPHRNYCTQMAQKEKRFWAGSWKQTPKVLSVSPCNQQSSAFHAAGRTKTKQTARKPKHNTGCGIVPSLKENQYQAAFWHSKCHWCQFWE